MQFIINTFDYWTAWHMFLAVFAYLFFYRFTFNKHLAFLLTIGLAVVWEVFEYFTGIENYVSVQAFFKNSMFDLGVALLAAFIVPCILIKVKLVKE